MWTALTLVVLAASTPVPQAGVALGSRVRLSAAPRVDVPGLFSGTARTHSSRPYERRDGLLVFARDDGSREAVIAPGARVRGTLVDADPAWLHVRLSEKGGVDRIARASVARVEVLRGRKRATRQGALVGLGAGAAAGATWFYLLSGPEGSDTPRSVGGFLVSAAVVGAGGALVGAGLGLLGTDEDWREVPRDALPGQPVAGVEGPSEDRELVIRAAEPGSLRRAIAQMSGPAAGTGGAAP
jgi:hypothetical protein